MAQMSRATIADRAGVAPEYVDRLVDLGMIVPDQADQCRSGDVRRATLAVSLEGAGIPLEAVSDALRRGALSLDFLDAESYSRFAPVADQTFGRVSERTGIPMDLLAVIREALGLAQPSEDDRMTEDELAIVPFLELQVTGGFRMVAIQRLLRVYGDSIRRITESEAAWWQSEVIEPALAAGTDVGSAEFADQSTPLAQQALLAIYRAQQARAWTANIIDGFEQLMMQAGIYSRLEHPPAICFLDIAGYTRLTQERGDEVAADLATTLARLVRSRSVEHGGKPIKWLGDGVMFHFRESGPAVRAALEMVAELGAAGLPPAHVGLHAGPVLYQEGDYFGQTVNLASRIADYARAGEVLVSEAVADASTGAGCTFDDLGPVELKGIAGATRLLRASLA